MRSKLSNYVEKELKKERDNLFIGVKEEGLNDCRSENKNRERH